MKLETNESLKQIDYALSKWEAARARAKHDDLSDLQESELGELVTTLSHTISSFAAPGSQFAARSDEVVRMYSPKALFLAHQPLYGVLKSLREAYERGYLQTVQELVHAEVFADFLEMAEYLLTEGYKDPAAVMVGGVLEEHLRKLSVKHGIPVTDARDGKARKASSLNDDLAKVAYDKLVQKGVTFWLDLRNKAAHGHYGDYDQAQVRLMLEGVRDFLVRFRA